MRSVCLILLMAAVDAAGPPRSRAGMYKTTELAGPPRNRAGMSKTTEEKMVEVLARIAYHDTLSSMPSSSASVSSSCTADKVRIRQEWGSLPTSQRHAYIKATQCLQQAPALTPSSNSSGAKTRFDDFVFAHINQTLQIHYTANFLSWHRYFVWLYEEALRQVCGYTGTQPYWDWAITARTGLVASPLFDGSKTSISGDGSKTSISGDGAPAGNKSDIVIGGGSPILPPIYLPTGNGGGCIKSGPFKDMIVNLGPVSLPLPGRTLQTAPTGNPLDWNPRCLKRDLTDAINRRFANASSVLSLLTGPQTVEDFQLQMQGIPGSGDIGVHGGGHYSIGGDPGRDGWTSPGDPAFYFHHANIDRMWWIWQTQSPSERQFSDKAIYGTRTFLNIPPSPNATLDDLLQYGFVQGPTPRIRDVLSTVAGPFCYVYL